MPVPVSTNKVHEDQPISEEVKAGQDRTWHLDIADADGAAVDLTSATPVTFDFCLSSGTVQKTGTLSGTPTVAPQVSVTLEDTDTTGLAEQEVSVYGSITLSDGTVIAPSFKFTLLAGGC